MSSFRELPDWARRKPPPGIHDVPHIREDLQRMLPEAELLWNHLVNRWEVFYRTPRGTYAEVLVLKDEKGQYIPPDQRLLTVLGESLVSVSGFSSAQKAWNARVREDAEREQARQEKREKDDSAEMRYGLRETARADIALESSAHFSENPLNPN